MDNGNLPAHSFRNLLPEQSPLAPFCCRIFYILYKHCLSKFSSRIRYAHIISFELQRFGFSKPWSALLVSVDILLDFLIITSHQFVGYTSEDQIFEVKKYLWKQLCETIYYCVFNTAYQTNTLLFSYLKCDEKLLKL